MCEDFASLTYSTLLDNNSWEFNKSLKKLSKYYRILVQWMELVNKGDNICTYFVNHNYKRIAVYGMADLGRLLVDSVMGCSNFDLIYGIDRNWKYIDSRVAIYSPDDELPVSDVVVITPAHEYIRIAEDMKNRGMSNVVSIEDVVYELY